MDFGRPVWMELSNDNPAETVGWRVIPRKGYEICDALVHFFGAELGLSINLHKFADDRLLDLDEEPSLELVDGLIKELKRISALDITLILVEASESEFESDLDRIMEPPCLRDATTDDFDIELEDS